MDKKICVTLSTLESHNHIVGDIECGVKLYERGGVDFTERDDRQYWAHVRHKNENKAVTVTFTRDGQDIEQHSCHCGFRASGNPVCRHIVAAVLSIQGGIIESGIKLGKKGTAETAVTKNDTAKTVGSGNLDVFSTPMMIALMEQAAFNVLADALEDGQTSVGININVHHTAATPVGMKISAMAVIESVSGRNIKLVVSAADESGEIGIGTHTRVIVDEDRFMKKVKEKIPSE